jgi:hypothetical protein
VSPPLPSASFVVLEYSRKVSIEKSFQKDRKKVKIHNQKNKNRELKALAPGSRFSVFSRFLRRK